MIELLAKLHRTQAYATFSCAYINIAREISIECSITLWFFYCMCTDTICRSGDVICPLGRIGIFEQSDVYGERCINESFVCDGIQDCVGGTDEVDCGLCKTFIAMHLMIVTWYCTINRPTLDTICCYICKTFIAMNLVLITY